MKVCIDPGHGGYDPGAVGPTGLKEKTVALEIALQVGQLLTQAGIQVCYTRTSDQVPWPANVNQDLAERCRIANRTGANLFVSIHCNAVNNPTAEGMEVYTLPGPGPADQAAEAIVKAWSKFLPQSAIRKDLRDGDSDKEANYYVLRKTSMPAILVEMGFISNPGEEKLLKDPAWQDRAARAIATGVAKHLGKELPAQPPALRLRVNGEFRNVPIRSVPPGVSEIQIAGTWIPVREIVTALGGSVRWNQIEKVVEVNFY